MSALDDVEKQVINATFPDLEVVSAHFARKQARIINALVSANKASHEEVLRLAEKLRKYEKGAVMHLNRQQVTKEYPICIHGRNAWQDDCYLCDRDGGDWAMIPQPPH